MRAAWAPLDATRKQFHNEYAITIRNNFSHHLGERDDYVKGIAAGVDDSVVLYETLGTEYAGVYREVWDSLFRTHGIEKDKHDAFSKATAEAHVALPGCSSTFSQS